jgi:histidine ammonia-lyase
MYKINTRQKLSIELIEKIITSNTKINLSDEAKNKIVKCRKYLDDKIKTENKPIYGINTGFGSLCNTPVTAKNIEKLQENLVRSHACGTGEAVNPEIIKIMLLLKIQGLSYGHSGVTLETVERLVYFYNHDILPVIFSQGSLGASGDLAPLAHLSLPLIGLGKVYLNGKKVKTSDALKKHKLKPLKLKAKEGLALLNGTQFMSAYAVWCAIHARKINAIADKIAAISIDAFDCKTEPFSELIQQVRPHIGQIKTAQNILKYLKGSEITAQTKKHVQDPYSFRCVPQVHGASKDTLKFVINTIETEINSVTDNPTIFPDENQIISGGNFHGQPLALALDFLAISISELSSISERRIYKLISGQRGLPPFLAPDAGLNSGFMIPQYTAASIVSQNKQLCTPSSVDTIDSSNGQEDHVSMGANAALKMFRIINNSYTVFAIELLTAMQAINFRRPLRSSTEIEKLHSAFRKNIPFSDKDNMVLHDLIIKSEQFLRLL